MYTITSCSSLSEIIMAYKLELKSEFHLEVLSAAWQRWSDAPADVFLISQEGHTVHAQR